MPTAILVDGGYFIRRYRILRRSARENAPAKVAENLFTWALRHLESKDQSRRTLYRIFFYDCPPLEKKAHNPVSGRAIDFAKTDEARFRRDLHSELKKTRKIALRLGRLDTRGHWTLRPQKTKELLSGSMSVEELAASDVLYDIRQKGVDMRIGIDIASLAFKRQVDQIVLVAGDSDFVPAAKLARREGIDFVLDPLWRPISPDLHEHIDGLRTTCPKPRKRVSKR